jgi:hypothetical protein
VFADSRGGGEVDAANGDLELFRDIQPQGSCLLICVGVICEEGKENMSVNQWRKLYPSMVHLV